MILVEEDYLFAIILWWISRGCSNVAVGFPGSLHEFEPHIFPLLCGYHQTLLNSHRTSSPQALAGR
jgi:hypothetical protein